MCEVCEEKEATKVCAICDTKICEDCSTIDLEEVICIICEAVYNN